MSWGLWVHAGDVVKEGVPALLDEVSNVGKACTTSNINVQAIKLKRNNKRIKSFKDNNRF